MTAVWHGQRKTRLPLPFPPQPLPPRPPARPNAYFGSRMQFPSSKAIVYQSSLITHHILTP